MSQEKANRPLAGAWGCARGATSLARRSPFIAERRDFAGLNCALGGRGWRVRGDRTSGVDLRAPPPVRGPVPPSPRPAAMRYWLARPSRRLRPVPAPEPPPRPCSPSRWRIPVPRFPAEVPRRLQPSIDRRSRCVGARRGQRSSRIQTRKRPTRRSPPDPSDRCPPPASRRPAHESGFRRQRAVETATPPPQRSPIVRRTSRRALRGAARPAVGPSQPCRARWAGR